VASPLALLRRRVPAAPETAQAELVATAAAGGFAGAALHPLSSRPRRCSRWPLLFLILLVVVPGLAAAVYYGRIASDQYVTEIQFGVRSADAQRNDASSMFQGMAAASQIGLQSNIIVQYIKSRELVDAIDRAIGLRGMFTSPSVDRLSRLPAGAPVEELVSYWRSKVEPFFDLTTGIITVRVRAFSPQDAQAIGKVALARSEALSEELSRRARADYVRFAQEQVDEAAGRLTKARQALLEFRDKEQTLDPTKEADAARLGIGKLREEMARVRTDLLTSRGQLGDKSPVVVTLGDRLRALEGQVKEAEARLVGAEGARSNAMSRNLRGYETLETERSIAEKFYEMALQSLQRAQFEANRQSWYLEVFVHPSLAERAEYPRRTMSTLVVVLVGFGAWIFLLMVWYSIREHV
jgi:capsular polysaccharide transport system permease protein